MISRSAGCAGWWADEPRFDYFRLLRIIVTRERFRFRSLQPSVLDRSFHVPADAHAERQNTNSQTDSPESSLKHFLGFALAFSERTNDIWFFFFARVQMENLICLSESFFIIFCCFVQMRKKQMKCLPSILCSGISSERTLTQYIYTIFPVQLCHPNSGVSANVKRIKLLALWA